MFFATQNVVNSGLRLHHRLMLVTHTQQHELAYTPGMKYI